MNRFTPALDALNIIDIGTDFERFSWKDIWKIDMSIYHLYDLFRSSIFESACYVDTTEEFSARNLFLSFLSNMSDEDLTECFRI